MDRWLVFGMLIAGGFGALTFLRIVGHEIVIQNREIEANAKSARERLKRRREAEEHERIEDALMSKRDEKQNGKPGAAPSAHSTGA